MPITTPRAPAGASPLAAPPVAAKEGEQRAAGNTMARHSRRQSPVAKPPTTVVRPTSAEMRAKCGGRFSVPYRSAPMKEQSPQTVRTRPAHSTWPESRSPPTIAVS